MLVSIFMIGIIWQSTKVVSFFVQQVCMGIWLNLYALGKWLEIFSTMKTLWKYLLPLVLVIVVGSIMTPFPLLVLVVLSFVPMQYVIPIIYVAFIVMMAK